MDNVPLYLYLTISIYVRRCRKFAQTLIHIAVVSQITYISPNEAELVAMADSLYQDRKQEKKLLDGEVPTDEKLKEPTASLWRMRHCIRALLDTGLNYIILTMGKYGAVLCSLSSTTPQNLK